MRFASEDGNLYVKVLAKDVIAAINWAVEHKDVSREDLDYLSAEDVEVAGE